VCIYILHILYTYLHTHVIVNGSSPCEQKQLQRCNMLVPGPPRSVKFYGRSLRRSSPWRQISTGSTDLMTFWVGTRWQIWQIWQTPVRWCKFLLYPYQHVLWACVHPGFWLWSCFWWIRFGLELSIVSSKLLRNSAVSGGFWWCCADHYPQCAHAVRRT